MARAAVDEKLVRKVRALRSNAVTSNRGGTQRPQAEVSGGCTVGEGRNDLKQRREGLIMYDFVLLKEIRFRGCACVHAILAGRQMDLPTGKFLGRPNERYKMSQQTNHRARQCVQETHITRITHMKAKNADLSTTHDS